MVCAGGCFSCEKGKAAASGKVVFNLIHQCLSYPAVLKVGVYHQFAYPATLVRIHKGSDRTYYAAIFRKKFQNYALLIFFVNVGEGLLQRRKVAVIHQLGHGFESFLLEGQNRDEIIFIGPVDRRIFHGGKQDATKKGLPLERGPLSYSLISGKDEEIVSKPLLEFPGWKQKSGLLFLC